MLLLFLFLLCGVFVQFFFHRQSRACGEADNGTEILRFDFGFYAPPLFLGVLILIQ